MKIIKRGGFREQAARQLKYKNSVNQRTDIKAQVIYQPDNEAGEPNQAALEPCSTLNEALPAKEPATKACATTVTVITTEDSIHKNN